MADHDRDAVTLEHIAREAGVSRATASRALTGSDTLSTPARERVRAVAERLGYVPNSLARALAGGTGNRVVVAVVGPDPGVLDDPYMWRVLSAAAAVGDEAGFGVALRWVSLESSATLRTLSGDRSVCGVVLVNTTQALLAEMPAGLRGRVVSIGIGGPGVPAFDVDNGGAAAAIVEHLLGSGRRRIAMLSGPEWMPCAGRPVAAYREAVTAAGLPVRVVPGGFGTEDGRAAALEAMRRWPDTDAIFAICDHAAFGALGALRSLGVRVPGDVAVAGFDDLPAAAWSGPALTTATHPVARIAAATAALLRGGDVPPATSFPSQIVLRESA